MNATVLIDEVMLFNYELAFKVSGDCVPYDPGRTWGDPEHCYPPEGGQVEDVSCELCKDGSGDFPVDRKWAESVFMEVFDRDEKFRDQVEQRLREQARENALPYPE